MADTDLKKRSEIVEDIVKSLDFTWEQVNTWPDKNAALQGLYSSIRGIMLRAAAKLKAEGE